MDAADSALHISMRWNYKYGMGMAYKRMGQTHYANQQYDTAASYYLISLELLEGPDGDEEKSSVHYNIARAYNELSQMQLALAHSRTALEIAKRLNLQSLEGKVSRQLGTLYSEIEQEDSALTYLSESVFIRKKLREHKGLIASLTDLGNCYNAFEKYDIARQTFQECIAFIDSIQDSIYLPNAYTGLGVGWKGERPDSALFYFREAVRLYRLANNNRDLPSAYNNLAAVMADFSMRDSALIYVQKSLALSRQQGQVDEQCRALINLSAIYLRLHEQDAGIDSLQQALSLARKSSLDGLEHECLFRLGELFSKSKAYEQASSYYQQSIRKRDSIQAAAALQTDGLLSIATNAHHRTEKDLNNQLIDKRLENQNLIIYVLALSLLAVIIIAVLWIRTNRQQNKLLKAREELSKQHEEVDQLMNAHENQLLNATLRGQDKAHQQIAETLHDEQGANLSMIKLHLSALESQLPANSRPYATAMKLLDESIQDIRYMARSLVPQNFTSLGLEKALSELFNMVNNSGKIMIEYDLHSIPEHAPEEFQYAVHLTVRELITNILKHAKASRGSVSLVCGSDQLNLIVEDNGSGFDFRGISSLPDHSFGLDNIHKRVSYWHGELEINSSSGIGTTVSACFPMPPKNP